MKVFTETQRFPHEQALGASCDKKLPFLHSEALSVTGLNSGETVGLYFRKKMYGSEWQRTNIFLILFESNHEIHIGQN